MNKEQLRILNDLDVDSALKLVALRGFIPNTKENALAGLHKVRIMLKQHFSTEQLAASRDWLIANNYTVPNE